ncbi:MAG: divalent-cation tolerance protein CutA [Candidatus Aminicenantes bacterium]
MKYIFVLTTVPDQKTGEKIARSLVGERLAACVNTTAACKSLFRWEGKVTEEQEFILFIKTRDHLFNKLQEKIVQLHPYDTPEVIAFPIRYGHPKYLDWIDKQTKTKP